MRESVVSVSGVVKWSRIIGVLSLFQSPLLKAGVTPDFSKETGKNDKETAHFFDKNRKKKPCIKKICIEGLTGHAEIVQQKKVRLLSLIQLKQGQAHDYQAQEKSLKTLQNQTNLKKVSLIFDKETLYIRVQEAERVGSLVFENNRKFPDTQLRMIAQEGSGLASRGFFDARRALDAARKIRAFYDQAGYSDAHVTPFIIRRTSDRVDLVFSIYEGPVSYIDQIFFIGNDSFSTQTLKSRLLTRTRRWYRFFSATDTYDASRVPADLEAVTKFYRSQGFSEANVSLFKVFLTPNGKCCWLYFVIEEGPQYTVREINFKNKLKTPISLNILKPYLVIEKGKACDFSNLEAMAAQMTCALDCAGHTFVKVTPDLQFDKKKKEVNVTFVLSRSPEAYINTIAIQGNTSTRDNVILREIDVKDGGVFGPGLAKKSIQNLEALDYFAGVNLQASPVEGNPHLHDITIDVREKSTGSLMFHAGYSNIDRFFVGMRASEENFLGKGQSVALEADWSRRTRSVSFGFTEPYLLGAPVAGGFDFSYTKTRRDTGATHFVDSKKSKSKIDDSYAQKQIGGGVRLGYNFTNNLAQEWRASLYREINETSEASKLLGSPFLRSTYGRFWVVGAGQTLRYHWNERLLDPLWSYHISLSNFLGIIDSRPAYMRHGIRGSVSHYLDQRKNWTILWRAGLNYIHKLGQTELRQTDRFSAGGSQIRGFSESGIGPRDKETGESLGGRFLALSTLELKFPLPLPKEWGFFGSLFTDWGCNWGFKSKDEKMKWRVESGNFKIRGSLGVGISWKMPLGVIGISFSKALRHVKGVDEKQVFRIKMGTDL